MAQVNIQVLVPRQPPAAATATATAVATATAIAAAEAAGRAATGSSSGEDPAGPPPPPPPQQQQQQQQLDWPKGMWRPPPGATTVSVSANFQVRVCAAVWYRYVARCLPDRVLARKQCTSARAACFGAFPLLPLALCRQKRTPADTARTPPSLLPGLYPSLVHSQRTGPPPSSPQIRHPEVGRFMLGRRPGQLRYVPQPALAARFLGDVDEVGGGQCGEEVEEDGWHDVQAGY